MKMKKAGEEDNNVADENVFETEVLYKYYEFNEYTEKIFTHNEIYFSSPEMFNDPFDSKISTTYEGTEEQRVSRLKDMWREAVRKGIREKETEETSHAKAIKAVKAGQDTPLVLNTLRRTTERLRKQMGIFCMTHKKDDILMWSHYADKHTGFCLEFQMENDFFGRAMPIEERHYSLKRPCLNLIEPSEPKIVEALLTKAKGWKDEEEWRIIDHINGPGPQTYPPEVLSGVILGCRISPENRQRITQLCRARNPKPTLYWAEEKDREFGLDIRLINQ